MNTRVPKKPFISLQRNTKFCSLYCIETAIRFFKAKYKILRLICSLATKYEIFKVAPRLHVVLTKKYEIYQFSLLTNF